MKQTEGAINKSLVDKMAVNQKGGGGYSQSKSKLYQSGAPVHPPVFDPSSRRTRCVIHPCFTMSPEARLQAMAEGWSGNGIVYQGHMEIAKCPKRHSPSHQRTVNKNGRKTWTGN